ncbi:hypothetical protein F2P56_024117 [Juglans regia]|uniref:Transcription factor bHLH110-like n=2 Tax=Juglans regia TaxID=51240 RepID=A0A2I4EX89_JUGRE|nr:transcription factor bHLH110-like [Juglans regia]KAF5454453.1 hypothetical protein F2P56_024117 [Juglans regia]
MESANFPHLHQLQEQFAEYFTSANQSGYKASITHDWNPSIVLNDSNYNSYLSESVPNSRDLWPKYSVDEPILRSSVSQDLSFCDAKTTQQSANEELHLAKFKEEMRPAAGTFTKLSEIVCDLSNAEASHLLTPKHEQQCSSDLFENICLGNFSAGAHISGQQPNSARDLYSNRQNSESFGGVAGSNRSYNFSHVFPSFPPSYFSSSLASNSLGLNLQTLDLLTSTNTGGNFSQPSHDILGVRKGSVSLSQDHMHELDDSPSNSSNKTTAFMNEVTRAKRPSRSSDQPKESHAEAKKSRSVSRCSCPPLKVRKEKLGDRIAALQKLVAPFGKTDTASVLTEAIGYIQFLHDRVQNLSMPYMRSSRSKPIIRSAMQPGLSKEGYGTDHDQAKPDLRSRGLCLLPKSCASYITGFDDYH